MKRRDRSTKKTFDKKVIRFITRAMVLSIMLLILVSGVSTMISIINKSAQMAMKEVDAMAANTEDNFILIVKLMGQIKEEEQQMNPIRLDALHLQIQPLGGNEESAVSDNF